MYIYTYTYEHYIYVDIYLNKALITLPRTQLAIGFELCELVLLSIEIASFIIFELLVRCHINRFPNNNPYCIGRINLSWSIFPKELFLPTPNFSGILLTYNVYKFKV